MPSSSKPRSLSDAVSVASTGVCMPLLGFGVYQVSKSACIDACLAALAAGYRHIDSAQVYNNETEVGQAVTQAAAKLGIIRKDIFLTTKIMSRDETGGQTMYESVANSVFKIGGRSRDAYVDLFLVHAPGSRQFREDAWKALEKLYEQGRAKTIGVSNFTIEDLEEMKEYATIWPPHVNQIEVSHLLHLLPFIKASNSKHTAAPVVSRTRNCTILSKPPYHPPGLQPVRPRQPHQRSRSRRHRQQVQKEPSSGAHSI